MELKVFRSGEVLTLSLTFDEDVPDAAQETQAEEDETGGGNQSGDVFRFGEGSGNGFRFGDGYGAYEDFFSQLFPFMFR